MRVIGECVERLSEFDKTSGSAPFLDALRHKVDIIQLRLTEIEVLTMARKEQELIERLHDAVNRAVAKRMERDRRIEELEKENVELRSKLQALLEQSRPEKRDYAAASERPPRGSRARSTLTT